jgi:hypothetical protein
MWEKTNGRERIRTEAFAPRPFEEVTVRPFSIAVIPMMASDDKIKCKD